MRGDDYEWKIARAFFCLIGLIAVVSVAAIILMPKEAHECIRNGTAVIDGKRFICVEYKTNVEE